LPKRPDLDYPSPYAEPLTAPTTLTPLAVILDSMRRKFAQGDFDGAVAVARIAAPYIHPRVPAAVPGGDLAAMPDADLDALQLQE
jgi:hypothetical protein